MLQLRAEQNLLYCRTLSVAVYYAWIILLIAGCFRFLSTSKLAAEIVLITFPCPPLFSSYLHLL